MKNIAIQIPLTKVTEKDDDGDELEATKQYYLIDLPERCKKTSMDSIA